MMSSVRANEHRFPSDIALRDTDALHAAGSLPDLAKQRHSTMAREGRLSRASIDSVVPPDDPDYQRLLDLIDGIHIDVAADFIYNGTEELPPLWVKYLRLTPAVNKLMAELHDRGLIFIIPTAIAFTIPGIHFSQTHWTVKKGKEQGRPIGDASSLEGNGFSLNCDEVSEICTARYGPIEHPTLGFLVNMVTAEAAIHGWGNIILWKMDLKGAFNLFFIHPDSCQRLAFRLTDDLTMISMLACLVGQECQQLSKLLPV